MEVLKDWKTQLINKLIDSNIFRSTYIEKAVAISLDDSNSSKESDMRNKGIAYG